MKARLTAILFLIFCLPAAGSPADRTPPARPSSPELQPTLETAYHLWRQAMVQKDFQAWQGATASTRQMQTRNRIVSQRLPYPAALFAIAVQAPALSQLVLLDIFAKGDTANAIYFGKPDFGLGTNQAVSDNFLVLKFIRETGQWKFDNLRIIKFGNDPDLLLQIRNQDFSFLQNPTFQPTGVVPPVPKAVGAPAYLAELWIAANGFDVTVNINKGNHRSHIKNDDGRDLVIGGLVKGQNTISLLIKPVPTESSLPKRLEIGIYATEAADQPAKRVFHYAPDPTKVPPSYSVNMTVR